MVLFGTFFCLKVIKKDYYLIYNICLKGIKYFYQIIYISCLKDIKLLNVYFKSQKHYTCYNVPSFENKNSQVITFVYNTISYFISNRKLVNLDGDLSLVGLRHWV